MLPTVQRQHLPGHRRKRKQRKCGLSNFFRGRAMLQRRSGAHTVKMFLRLPHGRKDRAGPDGVHPDPGRERECHGLRQGP